MEISGKIILFLELKTGTSKSGKEWISQDFVLETEGQYPNKVCIRCFGDSLCDQLAFYKEGDSITVKYNLQSNEHNGFWYTQVNAWNIGGIARNRVKQGSSDDPFNPDSDPGFIADSSTDDLPF